MKFQQRVQVLGFKKSKGTLDNGTAYDSTKAYIVLPMDLTKGDSVGQSCESFTIGKSDEFEKLRAFPVPGVFDADCEIVTNGNTAKMQFSNFRPAK